MFKEYAVGALEGTIQEVARDFQGIEHAYEDSIRFRRQLIQYFESHTWTIRFKPNVIRWPWNKKGNLRNRLSVSIPDQSGEWVVVGAVSVPRAVIGHVKDWPEDLRRSSEVVGS